MDLHHGRRKYMGRSNLNARQLRNRKCIKTLCTSDGDGDSHPTENQNEGSPQIYRLNGPILAEVMCSLAPVSPDETLEFVRNTKANTMVLDLTALKDQAVKTTNVDGGAGRKNNQKGLAIPTPFTAHESTKIKGRSYLHRIRDYWHRERINQVTSSRRKGKNELIEVGILTKPNQGSLRRLGAVHRRREVGKK
ncbi:hypothetical protein B0H19DRAFT_1075664 [Mycena capillaripes]|nr:hypothetical protein B0H19DRAFT_1075664 [Mycena capillaripes]